MGAIRHIWGIVRLMRPLQWVKNMFVFLPVFFGGEMDNGRLLVQSAIAFVSFCLASSAVYCLNDTMDAEADRQHPSKRHRPIASRLVKKWEAIVLMILLAAASSAVLMLLPADTRAMSTLFLAGYLVLQVLYCLWLKNHAIIDMLSVAAGFVLRVGMGGAACHIRVSQWIVLMTFLLALFLVLSKRRDDVLIYQETGEKPRRNTNRYNIEFVNQVTVLVTATALVCYIMYTVSPEVTERLRCDYVYLTSAFVLAGLIRYIQLMVVDQKSGSPTAILWHDRFIYCCVGGWILSFAAIIYL